MDRRRFLSAAAAVPLAGLAGCATGGEAAPTEGDFETAFDYAFPVYEFVRTEQERTGGNRAAAMNRIAHRPSLMDYTSRQVTAPNNDTIYSSCFLELSGGPVEAEAPSDTQRYWSIAFMSLFTDNFAYIGTRATKGQGGRFWVAGPVWNGAVPDGVTLIRAPTNEVWMLARIVVYSAEDLPAARALQQQIKVSVAPDRRAALPFASAVSQIENPGNFLAVVNEALARTAGGQKSLKGQVARASHFARVGIGPAARPSPQMAEAWRDEIPKGLERLKAAALKRETVIDGWAYQERGIGDFGDNDRLRAMTALGGLAAMTEAEAMYYQSTYEASGERLVGSNSYVWTVPPGGVPADAFWSLTMYQAEPDGRFFLTQNPINRYSIGDRTPGLKRNADGSIDILMQRHSPEGDMADNWLPTPEGPMRLALRAYLPKAPLLDRKWRVPPVRRVQG